MNGVVVRPLWVPMLLAIMVFGGFFQMVVPVYAANAFTELASDYGINITGYTRGAYWADVDKDGDQDLLINRVSAAAKLYLNNGVGSAFTDATATYGLDSGTSSGWIPLLLIWIGMRI